MILDELTDRYYDLQTQIHNIERTQTELLKDYVENDLGLKRNTLFKINNVVWFEDKTLVCTGDLCFRIFLKDMSRINNLFCQTFDIEALTKWNIEIVGKLDKDWMEYIHTEDNINHE